MELRYQLSGTKNVEMAPSFVCSLCIPESHTHTHTAPLSLLVATTQQVISDTRRRKRVLPTEGVQNLVPMPTSLCYDDGF